MAERSTRLRVRTTPGARRAGVAGRHGDAWKLRVRGAPEKGRANQELVALLSETLGVPQSSIDIEHGHTHRDKLVRIAGLEPEEVERRLEDALSRWRARPAR